MSSIREKVQASLKEAMFAKDKVKTLVYRNLISEFKKWEVDNIKTLTDETALDIIKSMIKQRDQSIEAFTSANRMDLLDSEKNEKAVLMTLMPAQKSEGEVRSTIEKIINNLSSNDRNMGAAMKAVMAELKGSADSKLISQVVKECLKI